MDIVDAQVPMTRRMLAFIGEPFDEACLRFHENERPALTLSSRQVKERLMIAAAKIVAKNVNLGRTDLCMTSKT